MKEMLEIKLDNMDEYLKTIEGIFGVVFLEQRQNYSTGKTMLFTTDVHPLSN